MKIMSDPAVVVTCHEPYLKWLPEALASIDRQRTTASDRIVVFDGCAAPALPGSWRAVTGEWHHPSKARNAGLATTTSQWIVFWDADNIMMEGYLNAMSDAIARCEPDVAILYPDMCVTDEHLRPRTYWRARDWDYWEMRAQNYVDTASVWRRDALEMAGGWCETIFGFEDHALALCITELGWKASHCPEAVIIKREHEEMRYWEHHGSDQVLNDLWKMRSLGIVTLLAGREETFDNWRDFLLEADLPPRTSLYAVDNSGNPSFASRLFQTCRRIADERGFLHLDMARDDGRYNPAEGRPYLDRGRHLHVARLYASALPRVREDLILTLEDDMSPPLDAVRRLVDVIGFRPWGNVGVAAAAYSLPLDQSKVCAGYGRDGWDPSVTWGDLDDSAIDVGCVGGGCAVWANWAVRRFPIHLRWEDELGWDAVLSRELLRRGYSVRLHGGVRCAHNLNKRPELVSSSPEN